MNPNPIRLGISVAAMLFLALAPSAYGANKLYAANNGVDSSVCGSIASPCRSITQAMANAVSGDTIIVGPGRYGDLNGNGILGEPGEEAPPTDPAEYCACMFAVNKSVTLISSNGAAETNIDARTITQQGIYINIRISAIGVQFGAPDQGFTVTNTGSTFAGAGGISIQSTGVSVRGNQVVSTSDSLGTGILIGDFPFNVLIEANQVIGWHFGGIAGGTNTTVNRNAVQLNYMGIRVVGLVTGNVVIGNKLGISIPSFHGSSVIGNEIFGNDFGIFAEVSSGGVVHSNNIFGNNCGIRSELLELDAVNNYWGAVTGPGADPADDVCGSQAGTVTLTPFATKPFNIKTPIKL
jgi:parallel beta-helix repeat protein